MVDWAKFAVRAKNLESRINNSGQIQTLYPEIHSFIREYSMLISKRPDNSPACRKYQREIKEIVDRLSSLLK